MEIILALIQQLNGAVFTLIAILLVVFWVLFKVGGYTEKFKGSEEERKEVKTDIKEIKRDIAKIGATTDLLYQAHLSTIGSHSPVKLTPKGEEISKAISAELKVNNHWSDIKAKLEAKNPSNPYDIQVVAMDIARDCFEKLFTEEEKNEIKTHAYRIGINLLEIYPIIGVIIRNRIFQERGLNVEDVDKHAPKS